MNRLFTSVEEIRKYINIDPNTSMEKLNPFIDKAEQSFIKPLLGAQYGVLLTDYTANGGSPGNEENQELLPYVQRPLSHHMMFLGLTQLSVHVGNIGVVTERAEMHDPVPKWRNDELRMDYLKEGDRHAEALLLYLEEQAGTTRFNAWYTDNAANTIAEGLICRSATIAMRHIDIEGAPRRLFLRMKKRIRNIELQYIKMLICKEQYDELVSNIQTDISTPPNQRLIQKLEPIIAKMALYQTIPMLQMHLNENGLTIYSSNDGTVKKQAVSTQNMNIYMSELKIGDFGYEKDVDQLKQFIEENIADYPLIANSSCYTMRPEPPDKTHRIKNTPQKRFFAT